MRMVRPMLPDRIFICLFRNLASHPYHRWAKKSRDLETRELQSGEEGREGSEEMAKLRLLLLGWVFTTILRASSPRKPTLTLIRSILSDVTSSIEKFDQNRPFVTLSFAQTLDGTM